MPLSRANVSRPPSAGTNKKEVNIIYEFLNKLCTVEDSEVTSFSVEGNSYFEFTGEISSQKFREILAILSGCDEKRLTILTNDVSMNGYNGSEYTLDLSLELIYHAKEEDMPYYTGEEREHFFKGLTDEQKEVYRKKHAIIK